MFIEIHIDMKYYLLFQFGDVRQNKKEAEIITLLPAASQLSTLLL